MMRSSFRSTRRRGTILPIVAVSFVALCGFAALAVDVGMVAVARTQVQNAADAAALTGARSFDGSAGSGQVATATTNGRNAAVANPILSVALLNSEIALLHGAYHYDTNSRSFIPQYPANAPDNYNLTKATITHNTKTAFASVLGITSFPMTASATAAHRPRDVAIVLDYSGSMNNESDLWNNEGYLGGANNSPNNVDSIFPRFGQYSSSGATLQCTSSDPRVGKCNITKAVLGMPAMVNDYYAHNRGATTTASAFTSMPYDNTYYYAQTDPGDKFLTTNDNSTSTFAKTVADITGGTSRDWKWELDGYSQYASGFGSQTDYATIGYNGYTQGPGYWGKTFLIWPPDPRDGKLTSTSLVQQFLCDFDHDDSSIKWDGDNDNDIDSSSSLAGVRKIFQSWTTWTESTLSAQLTKSTGSGGAGLSTSNKTYQRIMRLYNRSSSDWRTRFFGTNDNTKLWDSSGNWRTPSGNYTIDYAAILDWIKNSGSNPFPTQLRAGRILYYSAIPSDVPTSAYDHSIDNDQITNPDQRFWKEYIDYVLGCWRDPFGNIQGPGKPACSIGPDFAWGTIKVSAPPAASPYKSNRYMDYSDNPERTRHRAWFGPMTMVQFISDTKLLPGNAHDISMYAAKLGIAGAIEDILNNHPNDLVSLIPYSRPVFNNDPSGIGSFGQAQYGLTRNYSSLIDALWFPPNSGTSDVRPWDANDTKTPRAFGDYTSNTTTIHGFMLAYNQLSGNTSLQSGGAGGLGRKGAQRVVILETDGMANYNSTPTGGFSNSGSDNSYYKVRPGDTVNGGGYSSSALLQVVQALCNKADGTAGNSPGYSPNPGYPGYSLGRKPVQIHTIAFGAVFEPTASGSEQTTAVGLFQSISNIGGTTFPSSASDATNGYKWCIGTLDERKNKLRQAFNKIMDDGVSVSLIQ